MCLTWGSGHSLCGLTSEKATWPVMECLRCQSLWALVGCMVSQGDWQQWHSHKTRKRVSRGFLLLLWSMNSLVSSTLPVRVLQGEKNRPLHWTEGCETQKNLTCDLEFQAFWVWCADPQDPSETHLAARDEDQRRLTWQTRWNRVQVAPFQQTGQCHWRIKWKI